MGPQDSAGEALRLNLRQRRCPWVLVVEDLGVQETPLPATPPPSTRRRRSVLLVMRPGAGRQGAAEALRGAGYRVHSAREPYEGTARFVERPADLVVFSLAHFRRRDTAFIAAVKRRSPTARILLLVPEGKRTAAVEALQAGADAYALEPFYPAELRAVAAALLAAGQEQPQGGTAQALGRLAGEVAHAINNPLQILALLGESAELSDPTRTAVGAEIARIQGVMRILGRFGLLRLPQKSREALGLSLRQSLDSAVQEGRVLALGDAPEDGPSVSVDSSQAGAAFDSMLRFLAAHGKAKPVPVAARVRLLPGEAPSTVEAAVRGDGVFLEPEAIEAAREAVLLNSDETREVYPGLALAEAVARNHGGEFVVRATKRGTVLGMRLPNG